MGTTEDPVYPGEVTFRTSDSHSDSFVRDQVAVIAEHRWPGEPPKKMAAWIPVSKEVIEDMGWELNPITFRYESGINQMIMSGLRRRLFPWEFPDQVVLPEFELFPRWAGVVKRKQRVVAYFSERRNRLQRAIRVLKGTEPENYDDY